MRNAFVTACAALLFLTGQCLAVELAKIERTIAKLPTFTSPDQEYCLLVFGPDAQKRVWLIHDGPALYVDRNGNGDLTEADERVEANPDSSDSEEGVFYFEVGDIPDGTRLHKDLSVSWHKLDHLRDESAEIAEALARNPRYRGCNISIDVAMPNLSGNGLGGRVTQMASSWSHDGLLMFSRHPGDAPIIHFGGPWQITLFNPPQPLHIGRSEGIVVVVGTPGIGPSTTAAIGYEKVIPPGLNPKLRVNYPAKTPGQEPVVKSYELTRRCCTINLYGDVAVPEDVGTGTATVEISLERCPQASVSPSTHKFPVVPPKPGPKLEPVSQRLISKFEHREPRATISGVRFSPDGKRLIAGSYPGGIVQVWDVVTGKVMATMDAGEGYRASTEYFMPSPDWKTLYAWQEGRGTFTKVERDGKFVHSVQYHSVIRAWNLENGSLLRTFQCQPVHGIRMIYLAPNGRYFLSLDETPGEFADSRPRALTLWETATGNYRQVEKGNAVPGAISSDSRLVAVSVPTEDDDSYNAAIKLFEAPEWKYVCTIPFPGKLTDANPRVFAFGDKVLVGAVRLYEKRNDWQHGQGFLKVWDVASGRELLSIPAPEKGHKFDYIVVSPDGQTVAATTSGQSLGTDERVVIVDLASKTWKSIDVAKGAVLAEPAFHPSGKWLLVDTQVIPPGRSDEDSPEDLEQPRIVVLSVPEGNIVETVVAPQSFLSTPAFHPDGTMFATDGYGDVLLWDFRAPPGTMGTAAKYDQWLNKVVELEGPLAGGGTLDWQDYKDHIVLVDFWATWCQPCVAELPRLKAIEAKYRDAGLKVIGVSLDDDLERLAEFVKEQKVPWATITKPKDATEAQHPLAVKLGVEALPVMMLIDRDGKVIQVGNRLSEFADVLQKKLAK